MILIKRFKLANHLNTGHFCPIYKKVIWIPDHFKTRQNCPIFGYHSNMGELDNRTHIGHLKTGLFDCSFSLKKRRKEHTQDYLFTVPYYMNILMQIFTAFIPLQIVLFILAKMYIPQIMVQYLKLWHKSCRWTSY